MQANQVLQNSGYLPKSCRMTALTVQGAFPETHETFIGTYWGLISTPCTAEIVESASAYIIVGPLFNDYNTVAFTLLLDESECPAHALLTSPAIIS